MNTGVNPNILTICGTLLVLGALGAVTALALHGTITGQAAVIVFTTVVSLAGGMLGVHLGVTAGAKVTAAALANSGGATSGK